MPRKQNDSIDENFIFAILVDRKVDTEKK